MPLTLLCEVEASSEEQISWRSLPESSLDVTGELTFEAAPAGRGTELRLWMRLRPPGGAPSMALAPLWRRLARYQLGRELQRARQLLEAGEIATARMLPDGTSPLALPAGQKTPRKRVSPDSDMERNPL